MSLKLDNLQHRVVSHYNDLAVNKSYFKVAWVNLALGFVVDS